MGVWEGFGPSVGPPPKSSAIVRVVPVKTLLGTIRSVREFRVERDFRIVTGGNILDRIGGLNILDRAIHETPIQTHHPSEH